MQISTEEVGRRIRSFTGYSVVTRDWYDFTYLPFYNVGDAIYYAPLPYHHVRNGGSTLMAASDGDFNMWLLRARDSGKISIVIPDGRSVNYLHCANDLWDTQLPIPPGCTVSLSDDFHKLIMDISKLDLS